MDRAGLPDAAVLPRDHDQPRARTTSAARSRMAARSACRATRILAAVGAERRRWRWRRRRRSARALQPRRGRTRIRRARSPRPGHLLCRRQQRLVPDRLNRRTGELREVNPYPRMFSGEPSSALVERWQWTFPIIFSHADPTVLYTSSQHVWKTTNGGQSWDKISPDLTRHDPKTMGPSGGPITKDMNAPEVYGTVFAIGPGKKDVNIIWAGSDDGLVHVTRDGGKTLGERHAEGHAGLRAREPDRRVGVRAGRRLRRGQAPAPRRPRAVHLPHARLRQDLDEGRHRHSRQRLRRTSSARIRRGVDCSTPALKARSTCRSTTAIAGSRWR